MVYGDNRLYNIAVVVPDRAELKRALTGSGVDFSAPGWAGHPAVTGAYQAALAALGAGFKHFEQPRKALVVEDEWTVESGLITPTLKIKRRKLVERYRARIDQLYLE